IESKLDIHSLKFAAADGSVGLNEIAEVTLKTAQPVVFDTYAQNWTTGAGVLVDAQTHMTACAVMNAGSAE
ncbi:MAG TPA: sulfate adenylyltransferase, partial [Turneriella sp.]|nr:sulfate adenylyltransferase [Turneriella sp.]